MKISVCIATYQGAKYIREQLDSILCQIPKDAEVVISDDNSTDNTIEIIRSYNDSRIRIVGCRPFCSPMLNMENALRNARGEYVFMSDQDDVWLKDKVTEMMMLLKSYDLVVSNATLVSSDGMILPFSLFERLDAKSGLIHNLLRNGYTGCCMAFRRSLLKFALPFPKNIYMHDAWLGFIAEIYGTSFFYSKSLILYRRHGNTSTNTGEKSLNPLWKKIMIRMRYVFSLIERYFCHSRL